MATMDKRFLGVFMLLSTQVDWIHDLLPADGSKPSDFTKTRLFGVSADEKIQAAFYDVFSSPKPPSDLQKRLLANLAASKTQRDMHRQLFEILSLAMSLAPLSYSPPPCPRKETLQYIMAAVNTAPTVTEDVEGLEV